jgi:c-di-GMP-binding flagellar brake protein YcgR
MATEAPAGIGERRQNLRFNAVINGEFQIRGSDIRGLLVTDNFSKGGFKAVTNRKVISAAMLDCELTFPETIMPFFATGKVVWTREDSRGQEPRYSAGVELDEIDLVERQFLIDYCYRNWKNGVTSSGKNEFELE